MRGIAAFLRRFASDGPLIVKGGDGRISPASRIVTGSAAGAVVPASRSCRWMDPAIKMVTRTVALAQDRQDSRLARCLSLEESSKANELGCQPLGALITLAVAGPASGFSTGLPSCASNVSIRLPKSREVLGAVPTNQIDGLDGGEATRRCNIFDQRSNQFALSLAFLGYFLDPLAVDGVHRP